MEAVESKLVLLSVTPLIFESGYAPTALQSDPLDLSGLSLRLTALGPRH